MYLKNELKYSKRSDHVTDDVMSLFCSRKNLSGRTLLSCKFSLPCDETSTLYSPRPSFPTFSLMFIAPLILNSGRKLRLFLNAPHNQNLKYAILFKPNDEILSQQQKTLIQQWSRD